VRYGHFPDADRRRTRAPSQTKRWAAPSATRYTVAPYHRCGDVICLRKQPEQTTLLDIAAVAGTVTVGTHKRASWSTAFIASP
jgi:hypothetical protein